MKAAYYRVTTKTNKLWVGFSLLLSIAPTYKKSWSRCCSTHLHRCTMNNRCSEWQTKQRQTHLTQSQTHTHTHICTMRCKTFNGPVSQTKSFIRHYDTLELSRSQNSKTHWIFIALTHSNDSGTIISLRLKFDFVNYFACTEAFYRHSFCFALNHQTTTLIGFANGLLRIKPRFSNDLWANASTLSLSAFYYVTFKYKP